MEPSIIAVASIVVAVRGCLPNIWENVLTKLRSLIEIDTNALMNIVQLIEAIVERETIPEPKEITPKQQALQSPPSPMDEVFDGNETPTDIAEIDF